MVRPAPHVWPRVALAAVLAFALVALAGCSSASPTAEAETAPSATEATFPVTVTDDAGREVTVEAVPERIVSLAPANTEILYAIGLGDKVVGVTTYDDYPEEVADVAKMGDFIQPNIEAITAADPDLILATTGVQADVLAKLEAIGAPVVAIEPTTLEGVVSDVVMVGSITGATVEADELAGAMDETIGEIEAAVADAEPVTAFIEIGQNPLYTVGTGTLLNDMLTRGGGTNVAEGEGYIAYSLEQLVAANPEVYLATLGSMSDPSDVDARAGYDQIIAVKDGRVIVLEDNLVTRPGPRVVEGFDSIARALHPDAFE